MEIWFIHTTRIPFSIVAINHFENLIKELGWFTNMEEFIFKEKEYPDCANKFKILKRFKLNNINATQKLKK